MSKELEYFQDIIKVDEEALTLANKEKSKRRDVILHRQWLKQRKNVIEQALKDKEKKDKALELIKGINFDIAYREQFDEWTLFVVIETQDGKQLEPVAFGSGKEQYELLKETLL